MADAHSVQIEHDGHGPRTLLRLTLVALLLAFGFDALSTALVWDSVRALTVDGKRAAIHAVRAVDVRETRRTPAPDAPREP
ncbi:MAG TPA: hypothetical protein VK454_08575 [Myxococcaceae bacterium]|nr:hypothetical protein [Myxococcaceae bacterium]